MNINGLGGDNSFTIQSTVLQYQGQSPDLAQPKGTNDEANESQQARAQEASRRGGVDTYA